MSSRKLRKTLILGGILTGAAAPVAAWADAGPLKTARPELASASATSGHSLRACWDKPVLTTANITDANFFLQGYSEQRKSGGQGLPGLTGAPTPDPTDPKCAIFSYGGQSDLTTFSRLTIDNNAVTSTDSNLGIAGAVPLTNSAITALPGVILRPQLVTTVVSGGSVTYTFSRGPLAPNADSTKFGFYTNNAGDTNFHQATSATVKDSTVTVGFSSADQAILNASSNGPTRFVARTGAVADQFFVTNPLGITGTYTQRPDLAPTGGRLGPTHYAPGTTPSITMSFDFSAPVTVINAAGLHVWDDGGVRWDAIPTSVNTLSGGQRVTATFNPANNDLTADPAEVSLETVDAGAVQSATGSGIPGSDGAIPVVPVADHPMLTTGPDPIAYSINKSAGTVSVAFDEPIPCIAGPPGPLLGFPTPAPCAASPVTTGLFDVVDAAGNISPAPCSAPLLGGACTPAPFTIGPPNTVTVAFSSGGLLGLGASTALTDNAVGVIIREGAVVDAAGVPNPMTAFGTGPPVVAAAAVLPTTTTPTSTTPTTSTPTTDTGGAPTSTKAKKRKKKIVCKKGYYHKGHKPSGKCIKKPTPKKKAKAKPKAKKKKKK